MSSIPDLLEFLTEERRYLRIQPTEDPLQPATIERSITKLHRRARGGGDYPTYEFLLAAVGDSDDAGTRSLAWFVGVAGDPSADALAATRRALTACLPSSYDVVETTCSYADILELPIEIDDREAETEPRDEDTPIPDSGADPSDEQPTPVPSTAADPDVDDPPASDEESAMAARLDPSALASGIQSLGAAVADQLSHPDPEPAQPVLPDWEVAGVEFFGVGDRPDDWQLPLQEMQAFEGAASSQPAWPLASVCDGLAEGDAPTLVQLLVEPKPDWSYDRDSRTLALEEGEDLYRYQIGEAIIEMLYGPMDGGGESRSRQDRTGTDAGRHRGAGASDTPTRTQTRSGTRRESDATTARQPSQTSSIAASEARRIQALESVDTRRSFTVNARAIALERGANADTADETLRPLVDAFRDLEADHYRIRGTQYPFGSLEAARLFERVLTREFDDTPKRHRHIVPLVPNESRAIVADPASVGALCLLGGAALSSPAGRALATTPSAKTGLELPSRAVLDTYLSAGGMHIGHPQTANRELLDATVSLPPAAHPLHTAVFGSSGAGKTALGHDMATGATDATEGATILLDSKGDGGTDAFLRAHFARHGDLQDVYHFDCGDLLPAFPMLTIEPQLEAGIDRAKAVENVADRFIEVLAAYMGTEDFHNAESSVDVIEMLVKALFDPIHGSDTITQYELLEACGHMHYSQDPPTVSDPYLRMSLEDVTANSPNTFDNIMTGAARRIKKASKDARLRPLFNDHGDRDVAFDLLDHLDEQCVIVIDTSDYREDPRRLLTLVIVSQLWTALTRRVERSDPHEDLSQVNLFIEEAADVATADILGELLSQGRAFGVGVTLMMQFPQQVRDANPRLFRELIIDIGTHITGRVNDPGALAAPYTTGDLDRETVATRIANLDRGEWLVRLGDPWGDERPLPFVCRSRPLPRGHPDGDEPLIDSEETTYQAERTLLETRMYRQYGIAVSEHTHTGTADADGMAASDVIDQPAGEADADAADTAAGQALRTTIPHSERFPDSVTYRDEPPYPLVCRHCETRHPPTTDGMGNAIECCHDLAAVDREDIPITSVDLSLTATERRDSDYTDAQLRFLAAVYMAHQQAFNPDLEYDLVVDSMVRLQEYVGIDTDGVRELVEDGLLKRDCDHPHRLYTVTPEGRDEIQVGHREGVAHGDGQGDLSESSFHVALTEVGKRFLDQLFVADPDHPAVETRKYHDVADGRLDVAALDADGDVVVALEAERINHDLAEAVPTDFDKMANCDPEEAIWVVKNRSAGHEVLQALNEPADGVPRVEKTYSEKMRPQEFTIDTPGLTDVYTFQSMRNAIDD
ncbi:hypothetical protein HWV07_08585 [Natronomonas salina]|uniref:ATP-binding protein n=1 Tax=Natronomonas salina TaxID=1710540 RepID=UPI0015B685FC|nr:hypothetical protein [Natronomonas salina]QLD89083.1 hypothetical protein HWV07_08585 [Natronomonas salina]